MTQEDLIDELFCHSDLDMMVIKMEPVNREIERMMRNMDRNIKVVTSRPSNHHPCNPRRSR